MWAKESKASEPSSTVSIQNFSFSPAEIDITPGTTVIWINNDSTTHTTTSDTGEMEVWNSGNLSPGQSFSHTFSSPGTYTYHCAIHPSMHGTVKVTQVSQPIMNMGTTVTPAPAPAARSQSSGNNESTEYQSTTTSPQPAYSTTPAPTQLPKTGPPVTAVLLLGFFPIGLLLRNFSNRYKS